MNYTVRNEILDRGVSDHAPLTIDYDFALK